MARREVPQAQEGPALPPFRAELRVRAEDPQGWQLLGETLATWLRQRASRRLAVVCIGTDRSTGDALGPLVGTLLARSGELPAGTVTLMGTLEEPVHAGNLDQAIARLATLEPGTTVLAVDACLGRSENVGSISAGRGALQPGAGVNKSLPAVGHLFVTGTVNVGGFMEYFVLQNTRLGLVLRMAEAIAAGIALATRLHFGTWELGPGAAGARPWTVGGGHGEPPGSPVRPGVEVGDSLGSGRGAGGEEEPVSGWPGRAAQGTGTGPGRRGSAAHALPADVSRPAAASTPGAPGRSGAAAAPARATPLTLRLVAASRR